MSAQAVLKRSKQSTRPSPTKSVAAIPLPPTDKEKYSYLGRQHRWFITVRTLAACSTAISLLLFSDSNSNLWLFWIVLMIFGAQAILSHYTTARKRVLTKHAHDLVVMNWRPARAPGVDVFLPSCGEDLEVLDNTYSAVQAMAYRGKVVVHVLDDSNRPEVAALAAEYGFRYAVRSNRPHMKKAGNLKFGYESSTQPFIVIFDADFAPRADFLTDLLPYFGDSQIGIVQSPQFFGTSDDMPWLQRSAGQVQESFYRWAQPSRDALGAPICVGTCAIYRRAALAKAGGFAQIGHSEDVHTGVNMLKAGFRTMYVPVVVAKGLCPDQLSAFISQQYRWCAGSMSLLVDKAFHSAPLTFRQRLCFYTGFGYYISTAVGVFLLSLPTVVMLWIYPDKIHLANFFWMAPTLLLYPLIRVMHKSGWSPAVLRASMISSFSHALAIWHILRGHPAEWVPTGKAGRSALSGTVMRMIVLWEVGTGVMQALGLARFLASGHSIIDAAPILLFAFVNAGVWIPIVVLIAEQTHPTLARPMFAPQRAMGPQLASVG